MIDPQIALSTTLPPVASPIQTLGSLALMQDRGALAQDRREQIEQRQRSLDDDAATRGALQTYGDPDDAIASLYRQGRATAAGNLSKNILATRNAQNDGITKVVDSHQKAIDFATNIMAGVKDQKSLDAATPAVTSVLHAANLDDLTSLIPSTYDPDAINKVVQLGAGAKKQLDEQKGALENKQLGDSIRYAAVKSDDDHQKAVEGSTTYYRQYAASILGGTTSQQDLQNKMQFLAQHNVPTDVLQEFGNQWSPDFPKAALQRGMSPDQVSNAAHQATSEDLQRQQVGLEGKRVDLEQQRLDQSGGGKALTPNARASIIQRQQSAYGALEKEVRANPDMFDSTTGSINPAGQSYMAQRKLQIENATRTELGQPTLEQAEYQYSLDPSQSKNLRQVRNVYRNLTGGQDAPLERAQKIMAQLKLEKNPAKAADLRNQLKQIYAQYATPPAVQAPNPPSDQPQEP